MAEAAAKKKRSQAKLELVKKKPKLSIVPPSLDTAKLSALRKKYDAQLASELYEEQRALGVYSSGCLPFDLAIGVVDPIFKNGGLPQRSAIELFGDNGVYKSGTLEQFIKSVQDRGKIAVVLYTEEPNFERMRRIGINLDMLVIIDCYKRSGRDERVMLAERRLRDLVNWSEEDEVGLIGIDSLKSMTSALGYFEGGDSKKGKDRPFEDQEVAVRARMMEKFWDRVKIRKNDHVSIVIVNHMNEHIPSRQDKMNRQPGENDRPKTSGGRRKEFEMLLRVQVKSKPLKAKMVHDLGGPDQPLESYRPEYGKRVWYKIWKNKYSQWTGMRTVACDFIYADQAFDNYTPAITFAVYLGIIKLKGQSDYSYQNKKWKGKAKVIEAFKKSPKAYKKLVAKLYERRDEIFAYRAQEKKKAKYVLDDDRKLRDAALTDDD